MSRASSFYAGKTALITGGASGFGAALGRVLAGYGCHVVLADIQESLAEQVAAEIRASGGEAKSIYLDVCDYTEFEQSIKEILSDKNGRRAPAFPALP